MILVLGTMVPAWNPDGLQSIRFRYKDRLILILVTLILIPVWIDFDSERIDFDSRILIPPLARNDSGVWTIDSTVNTN